MWTKRDHAYWDQLMAWEQQLVSDRDEGGKKDASLLHWMTTSVPEDVQERLFEKVDLAIAWVHSFMQKAQLQTEARSRVLATARIFDEEIETIEEIRSLPIHQLHYISRQQMTRSHFLAAVQGAITGTGSLLPITADFFSLTLIQLRVIQLTALSYGFDADHPIEKENVLHVLYAAMLPKPSKADGWAQLITEVEERSFYIDDRWTFDESMLQEPLQHVFKLAAVRTLRHQTVSGMPLFSMAIGVGINCRAVKQTAAFAERYYQYRYLHEKKNRS